MKEIKIGDRFFLYNDRPAMRCIVEDIVGELIYVCFDAGYGSTYPVVYCNEDFEQDGVRLPSFRRLPPREPDWIV